MTHEQQHRFLVAASWNYIAQADDRFDGGSFPPSADPLEAYCAVHLARQRICSCLQFAHRYTQDQLDRGVACFFPHVAAFADVPHWAWLDLAHRLDTIRSSLAKDANIDAALLQRAASLHFSDL